MNLQRRSLLAAGAMSVSLASPSLLAQNQKRTVKVCTFRVLHGLAPYFYQLFMPSNIDVEVLTFDSPTDAKNAVVTRSVDFGAMGIAAATLGAAAGEPITVIGAFANKGMGVIAKAGSNIKTVKDLKGKRVGIWPGSTQEVFIRERLRMEGMSIKDLEQVRVPFGEMHTMLARGEIDAFVGSETAPSMSISSGVGQLVEYPYGTRMGGLNMVLTTHFEMADKNPELVRTLLTAHRRASTFMNDNKQAVLDMAVSKLGANRAAVSQALQASNVEYVWNLTPAYQAQARAYADQMLELKQIRNLPDFKKFIDTRYVKDIS